MQRTTRLLALIAGLCASTLSTQAVAQKYPVRPVKIMVGFSAGGPVDVVARIVGDRLGAKLGQPFVVENRAGANGMIAAEGVAHAEADGYTILACNSSTITLNKTLFKDIRYDPISDFAPLTTVVSAPLVLVVNPEIQRRRTSTPSPISSRRRRPRPARSPTARAATATLPISRWSCSASAPASR